MEIQAGRRSVSLLISFSLAISHVSHVLVNVTEMESDVKLWPLPRLPAHGLH